MNHKLSFNKIAATLAALSVSTAIGCGGSANQEPETAVDAKEVPEAPQEPEAAPSQSTEQPGETTPADQPAPSSATDAPGEPPTAAAEAPAEAEAKPVEKKTGAKKSTKKAAGAKGSCGAGTCG